MVYILICYSSAAFNIWINGIVISVKDGNIVQNAEFKNVMAQILFLSCFNFNSNISLDFLTVKYWRNVSL